MAAGRSAVLAQNDGKSPPISNLNSDFSHHAGKLLVMIAFSDFGLIAVSL